MPVGSSINADRASVSLPVLIPVPDLSLLPANGFNLASDHDIASDPTSITISSVSATRSTVPETWQTKQAALKSGVDDSEFLSADQQHDVIDRGLLNWDAALLLFRRYQRQLVPCYPIVPLPDTMDASQFRRQMPVLFLATLSAAAAVATDDLRDALHQEVLETYAKLIMIEGVKSLELLQALLVTIAWYRPCSSYNDTKYLQFIQTATLMAQELNLQSAAESTSLPRSEFDVFNPEFSPYPTNNAQSSLVQCRALAASFILSSRNVSFPRQVDRD